MVYGVLCRAVNQQAWNGIKLDLKDEHVTQFKFEPTDSIGNFTQKQPRIRGGKLQQPGNKYDAGIWLIMILDDPDNPSLEWGLFIKEIEQYCFSAESTA